MEQDIIKYYLQYKSTRQVANMTGISRNKITHILKSNGIKLTQSCLDKKPEFKEDFFTQNNEHSNYWLGFLWADGYLSNQNSIRLEIKDEDHLIKFCKDLSYPIDRIKKRKDKDTYYLNISSKKMSNDLKKLNFKQDITHHNNVHFLRGFFDGDGSIYHQGKNSFCTSLIGTLENLKHLATLYPFKVSKFRQVSTSKEMYRIETHGIQSSLELCNHLYENASIFLTRKYCKYLNYKYIHGETSTTKLEPSLWDDYIVSSYTKV